MLGQAQQLADNIQSQVAEKSRELAEMNERLMAFGNSLLAALGRTHALFPSGRRDTRAKKGRSTGSLSASPLQLPARREAPSSLAASPDGPWNFTR